MNSAQLRAWLRRRGCTFERKRGTGHMVVRLGDRKSVMPTHGGSQQLGTGLIRKIMRDLGIEGPVPG
ncbi:MAG: type II toxin-antitoxin system HicA family toxin [Gemmatimonadetes bacterium]|nr:type II toxin-antitoxin system HicA family toxin [Gemmatimonadota bacterium]